MLVNKFSNLLPIGSSLLSSRSLTPQASNYINDVCNPLASNFTYLEELGVDPEQYFASAAANSPFPCEQEQYQGIACKPNGTTAADYRAEQQCLCNGPYFDVGLGCNLCFWTHGEESVAGTPPGTPADEQSSAIVSAWGSYSTYVCSATVLPSSLPLPYYSVETNGNVMTETETTDTLGPDHFPSQTAVSDYWTAAKSQTKGETTESSSKASSVASSAITSARTGGITSMSSTSPTSTGSGTSASASGNVAMKSDAKAAGGFLVAMLGIVAFL